MNNKKKTSLQRLILGFIQHMLALAIMCIIGAIILNSYVKLDFSDGGDIYFVDPLGSERDYDDSVLFNDIFDNSVRDIIKLTAAKDDLEVLNSFLPKRRVNISDYASKRYNIEHMKYPSVDYVLDDLIKWSQKGVTFSDVTMNIYDFANYFGDYHSPANFSLTEDGVLIFSGFQRKAEEDEGLPPEEIYTQDELKVKEVYDRTGQRELAMLMGLYVAGKYPNWISITEMENEVVTVNCSMINCLYSDKNDNLHLSNVAGDWLAFFTLQDDLVKTIEGLSQSYNIYTSSNNMYSEERSNIKYMLRKKNSDGNITTITNLTSAMNKGDDEITDIFSEFDRYLIYYPDSLEFSGNCNITEEKLYEFMKGYEYAFPESTHIWIGLDTDFTVKNDSFYKGAQAFNRIVPHISVLIALAVFFSIVWIALFIYLTLSAGVRVDDDGNATNYTSPIDHVWGEIIIIIFAFLVYGGFKTIRLFPEAISFYYNNPVYFTDNVWGNISVYGMFCAAGFLVSFVFCITWYSTVRRLRSGKFFISSFVGFAVNYLRKLFGYILSRKNIFISSLIPYNTFLLINLLAVILMFVFRNNLRIFAILALLVILLDGFVGVKISRYRAEIHEIREGIARIKDGETRFKIDTFNIHGNNLEMANNVNNIGQGIDNAVKTSVKDEKLKTDLITNVSHDIKTPLTSIISYVDLLKRENITAEPAKGYIDILDAKSKRLKQLTDDLLEVSKISFGNIVLNINDIDIAELVSQALGEFAERFEERGLETVYKPPKEQIILKLDGMKTFRIIENLFNNICKYALENTRVFIDIVCGETRVDINIKNISKERMNLDVSVEDLTERFIRGDASRTTEGSGLGLSIAKSLTEAMGGTFSIDIDGDMFKARLSFPKTSDKPEEETTVDNSDEKSDI
ncbi:MAG: HAMP domain-containing histidine kinase [Lachnospiraceae bacterium]|nr:HAMP domain-containing histidine kinase [Lachnospiraceae bacterium]